MGAESVPPVSLQLPQIAIVTEQREPSVGLATALPPLSYVEPVVSQPKEVIAESPVSIPVKLTGRGIDANLVPSRFQRTLADPVQYIPPSGATWTEDSSLPGRKGNAVIAGHNYALPALEFVQIGDVFQIIMADGTAYEYMIKDRFIVQEEGVSIEQRMRNGDWLGQNWPNEERLTVVTCWPFPSGTSHRLILVGERR